eukprot:TRINITY_DN38616_c0_g1_i1.p1 TRINITY_DN38616_c0_g1~~TRINITY_DN38616_c0_g1_i1.p1  ORF type:complete len:430 (-),score=123.12 TRINITY_DN38616_c0_g1_i1:142-1431(-)
MGASDKVDDKKEKKEETEEKKDGEDTGAPGPKFLPPRTVTLKVPEGLKEGQAVSFPDVDGRMMQAHVPKDKKEGDEFEVTLPAAILLTVPENAKAGDRISFPGPNGVMMQAVIPEGKAAGEKFEAQLAAPPPPSHVTLTVPEGAEEGKEVGFVLPGGEHMKAVVPPGKKPGDTFQVQLQPPRPAHAPWKVKVPEDGKPGDPVTFDGPYGQRVTATVPHPKEGEEALKPGDTFLVHMPMVAPPQGKMQTMTVVVPKGNKPGDSVSFKGADGQLHWTQVPAGLKEGERFNVQVLVRDGPQTPEQAKLGQLCNLASGEDLEPVKKLIEEGVPVNGVYDLGFTALTYAAMNGRTEIVKYLIGEKADLDARTHDVRTALHFACRNGHTATAKVLLDAKSPTDVKDVLGRTALATAEEKGQKETAEALRAAGVKE